MTLIKNPQFYSDLAEILAILPTHGLIILAKFDEDRTKIANLLLLVYFWASIIFFESVSIRIFNRFPKIMIPSWAHCEYVHHYIQLQRDHHGIRDHL